MNAKNDVSFKKQFQEAMLTQEFSGSWLLKHAILSHPQKADPSSPNTPSSLSYLQAHTSRSPVLFLLSHPILSPWDMLMIIPLLTPSPSDRLWHWKPKRSQRTPVKCSLEGEWKGILHPAQPLGTIFPAQILEGEGRGTTCPRAKGVEGSLQNQKASRSAGTQGKSWVKFWLDFSLLAAMTSQEALKAAETETLPGRRHRVPQETLQSVSATRAQAGSQLWPVRCHTQKWTFSNGAF